MTEQFKNLYYLEELPDYKVNDEYSDVRGWEVIDVDSRIIGKVTNLLVSKKAERVVYLDVEVDKTLIEDGYNTYQVPASEGIHGFINRDGEDHLIVPIGMVGLDNENKNVLSNQINYTTFAKARRFNKVEFLDPEYELFSFRHYLGDEAIGNISIGDTFYNRKEFKNTLGIKKE